MVRVSILVIERIQAAAGIIIIAVAAWIVPLIVMVCVGIVPSIPDSAVMAKGFEIRRTVRWRIAAYPRLAKSFLK